MEKIKLPTFEEIESDSEFKWRVQPNNDNWLEIERLLEDQFMIELVINGLWFTSECYTLVKKLFDSIMDTLIELLKPLNEKFFGSTLIFDKDSG